MYKHKGSSGVGTWIVGILLLLFAALFAAAGISWLAIGLLLGTIWIFVAHSRRKTKINAALGEIGQSLRGVHNKLAQIRDEVASGSYNSAAIQERLKAAETEGAYVPSIIYSLLQIRS
jgi:hypothetical protein